MMIRLRRWKVLLAALAVGASSVMINAPAQAATVIGGVRLNGTAFDTCATSTDPQSVNAYKGSYDATVAYFGGINAQCTVSPSWVQTVVTNGWKLIPTYVGRQAPSNTCPTPGCISIDPGQASAQGAAAATDAINLAKAAGIGPGSPIYFDMEYYSNPSDDTTVLTFLSGWTSTLKRAGFVSGVYGDTAIKALSARYDDSTYQRPDAVWIDNAYRGAPPVSSAASVPGYPDAQWKGHRIVQYQWGEPDKNFVDGDVAGAGGNSGGGGTSFAHGTVSTPGSTLAVRTAPYSSARLISYLPDKTVVEIRCQWTKGTSVTGPWGTTATWDKINLQGGGVGYLSDAWVYTGSNGLVAPPCNTVPSS